MNDDNKHLILVVGAGPAGIFAARKLGEEGEQVVLLNRDIKPGGLGEYGIYYDKFQIKYGLRKQFRQILAIPEVHYMGNVTVGEEGDISLNELRAMGFKSIIVAAGAQGTKWLGLPGEELQGVYHAKDIVYHYNDLPPYSTKEFKVRGRVALVGVGNVMVDIAHWAIRDLKVDEVIAVARRGPAEVKFSEKEMEHVIGNLDIQALDKELARCEPFMQAVEQNAGKSREYILSALPKAEEKVSKSSMRFNFLASPVRIVGNDKGQVTGLEVEETKLVMKGNDTKAVGLGIKHVIDVDTVIFCVGDKVDKTFGLPIEWDSFVKNPQPNFPINDISYETFDKENNRPLEGIFVAGWSREASNGLVGLAKKDGECCAKALLEYLSHIHVEKDEMAPLDKLEKFLAEKGKQVVLKDDVARLEAAEQEQIQKLGVKDFKFKTNEEMLAKIGFDQKQVDT
jgi:ferredoxin/flavodoxin---NADP+ reductase